MRKDTDTAARSTARDYTRRDAAKRRAMMRRQSRCTKAAAVHLFTFA